MKCEIFCLLAFCAFETVFADNLADEDVLSNYLADNRMGDVWNQLNSDMQAAVDATKMKKIESDEVLFKCWTGESYPIFSEIINIKGSTCMQCYDKYKKNIKSAKNCCNKVVAETKKEAKSYLVLAKKCIAKCAQSEDDCLKEIKKQRKAIDDKWNIGEYPGESKKTKNLDTDESKKTKNV